MFNFGDRVRILPHVTRHGVKVHTPGIFTVLGVSETTVHLSDGLFYPIANVVPEEGMAKFKTGDKVKSKGGTVYTVLAAEGEYTWVKSPSGACQTFYASNLEPYLPPAPRALPLPQMGDVVSFWDDPKGHVPRAGVVITVAQERDGDKWIVLDPDDKFGLALIHEFDWARLGKSIKRP